MVSSAPRFDELDDCLLQVGSMRNEYFSRIGNIQFAFVLGCLLSYTLQLDRRRNKAEFAILFNEAPDPPLVVILLNSPAYTREYELNLHLPL